ncbi:hypothetical protein F8M41_016728 [Gigaspora margarita]|nr:hypothetical protein F8M41_016728 [Gigaspora margarita]
MANFVYREEEGEGSEQEEEPSKPMEKYYEWIEKLNQKFKRVLSWSEQEAVEEMEWSESKTSDLPNLENLYGMEPPKWGRSTVGVEFSDNDMEEDKEAENRKGLEYQLSEELSKKLNKYQNRDPDVGPLMSPFPDPAKKRFCIEEYNEELKKQKVVLDFFIEAEGSD